MATQTELAELKRVVQEMNQKMDKQMVMVQGLVDLFTSVMSKPDLGLVKEPPHACHTPAVGTKLCSKDMFKDLVEFHEARTHPKEDADSLSKANPKRKVMHSDEIDLKDKREHPVDGTVLCSCKASKDSTLNPQSSRRSSPRTFSCLFAPLASVYEKLLDAGSIRPLTPTPLPKNPTPSHNPNHFCTYHQMPGHSTNACFRLRHAIQNLIDNGTIPAPLPSKPDVISSSMHQHNSNLHVSQISISSTQINPSSAQIKPSSTIFNPTLYIIPESQSKPITPPPSEPEVNLMTIGAIDVFTAATWADSGEKLAKEEFKRKLNQSRKQADGLMSFDQRSTE